ncbi:reverse transcriptase domain-containing protein [Tanacetum coccineum]|uniref:Reverse transcriptase domain-containing protein n=1 Tax=Tanacetum coccineum TaxID=301880 RepID=A0ABQ5E8F5_9ASTR
MNTGYGVSTSWIRRIKLSTQIQRIDFCTLNNVSCSSKQYGIFCKLNTTGRVEEDVVDHIAKILEILYLIKMANVDPFQLRIKVFHLSLIGDARKWWMNERDGKINTWEELVKKFFGKFYPLSCASNYDRMCDDDEEGCDSLEFITWVNLKFKDHKRVDETTKHALLHSCIEVGKNEGTINDIVLSDDEWEESDYRNPPKTNDDSFL